MVKVADFSALDHLIISPMWVRASLGARVTCGTSQVLLAGVSGGFSLGTPVFAPPTVSIYVKKLERDVKLNQKKKNLLWNRWTDFEETWCEASMA